MQKIERCALVFFACGGYNGNKKEGGVQMREIFKDIPAVRYEGAESKNPLAFKFYDADKMVLGKR